MFIEVYQAGRLTNRVPVEIQVTGFTVKCYHFRKMLIDFELEKLRKVYPYGQFVLAFESRMNQKIIA